MCGTNMGQIYKNENKNGENNLAEDTFGDDIFDVIKNRFKSAVDGKIGVIKKYGWRVAIMESVADFLGEIIPVGGGFGYGCYRLIVLENLEISDFSVLISAITNTRNKLNQLARYFAMQQKHCLWVQNLRDFLNYEPQLKGGDIIPGEFESLEFKNVSFRYYKDSVDKVLDTINLTQQRFI